MAKLQNTLVQRIDVLKDELQREKESNATLAKLQADARNKEIQSQKEIDRLTNELGAAKTKLAKIERMFRGLRDAFLAATEEDASGRPFHSISPTRG